MSLIDSQRLRILVIDDDPSYRLLARESLSGHERWVARTAKEGLEMFHQFMPDMVFLDIGLPDESGLEVLAKLRQIQPESFVVMLTASRDFQDITTARRHAANGYITKPFSRSKLQFYCEACIAHWDKLEHMSLKKRLEFRAHMRSESA